MTGRGRWLAIAAQYAFVLWAAITLNFLLPRLMPGNPIALLAGTDVNALSASERDTLLRGAGLDRPLAAQYIDYLRQLAAGDLGFSYQRNEPAGSLVARRLPWTLLLTATSQVLSLLLGLMCALTAARFRGGIETGLVTAFVCIESLPVFWIGMMLLALLAVEFPLFPAFGAVTLRAASGWARVVDVAHHLVLPMTTLAIAGAASVFLTARAAMADVLHEPFLAAARARGVGAARTLVRHGLPNALLPLSTVFVMNLAVAFGSATLVETVYAYPGLGRLIYEAVLSRDYPVLHAAFLLLTVIVVLANLLLDLVYPLLDPRVRRRGAAS